MILYVFDTGEMSQMLSTQLENKFSEEVAAILRVWRQISIGFVWHNQYKGVVNFSDQQK